MPAKTDADTEDIKEQFEILRSDVNRLVSTLAGTASAKKDRTVEEISEEVERLTSLAKRRADSAREQAEETITGNPFQSVLLALGLGFLIGALTRR